MIVISKKVSGNYSWSYINLPKEVEDKMKEFGEEIDKEDLYVKEADDGLETEFHVTVKYGLLTDNPKEPKGRLEDEKGGEFYLGESSIFETEKYDVVKMEVESEDLKRIHDRLNELPHEDKYPDYKAHATIAYVKKGKGKKYVGKFKIDQSFKFKEVYFGDKQKKNHEIKLSNMFNDWSSLRRF
jgi:2'-5' RNA ligase